MANTFLKPEIILASAFGMLRRELILGRLVTRLGAGQFKGAQNDTVNFRIPAILTGREYEFRTRSAPIIVDELEEVSIPATLDRHLYSAVGVTDEELSLDIVSFSEQVLQPQVLAVATAIEDLLALLMVNGDYSHVPVSYTEGSSDDANFYKALVDARKVLNDSHVPSSGRVVLLGSEVEAAALKEDSFRKVDESGSNDALREAVIGRVAGFTVIGNVQSLPGDFAIAYHPSAFGMVNMAPEIPAGVAFGASSSFENYAMRWIRDYDSAFLRDRSVLSTFAGFTSVEDERDDHGDLTEKNARAVLIDFTAAS